MSSTKSTACFKAFLFPEAFLIHSLSISLVIHNILAKSSSTVRLLELRAYRKRFLNSSIIKFLDWALLPTIKIFKAHKNWTLGIPWDFLPQNSLFSLVVDRTSSITPRYLCFLDTTRWNISKTLVIKKCSKSSLSVQSSLIPLIIDPKIYERLLKMYCLKRFV